MMMCKEVAEKLLLFRDGDLPEDQVQFVREHLHMCAPCLELLNSYEEVVEILARLRPVNMPEGFLEQMKTKLHGRTGD